MEEHPELVILDTWILRLGKSEEEAGKFEPWHMTPDEFEEDFQGFLACLSLTRLVDSVKERMASQKVTIRAVKKEQRETAKALKKEQEKLQKALDKAAAKIARELEKQRIKAEAKAERERLKAEKKMGVTHRVEVDWAVNPALLASNAGSIPAAPTITQEATCTSTSKGPVTTAEKSTLLDSTCPTETSMKSLSTLLPTTPTPEQPPQSVSIISTVEVPTSTQHGPGFYEETETYIPKFNIPREG